MKICHSERSEESCLGFVVGEILQSLRSFRMTRLLSELLVRLLCAPHSRFVVCVTFYRASCSLALLCASSLYNRRRTGGYCAGADGGPERGLRGGPERGPLRPDPPDRGAPVRGNRSLFF